MFLQREHPLIPIVYDQMVSFLTKLAGKFLPVAAIRAAEGDFYTVNYKESEDQLQGLYTLIQYLAHLAIHAHAHIDQSIFVGIMTKRVLQKVLDDGEISPLQVTQFYKGVRAFYVRALEYALDNLPLKDDLLKNASFVSYKKREDTSFSQVEYFVHRFVRVATHVHTQSLSLSLFPPSTPSMHMHAIIIIIAMTFSPDLVLCCHTSHHMN
jgi:hypothetical protein